MNFRPTFGDWAGAASTLAWDLTPDLVASRKRRRLARAAVALAGFGAVAWSEREALSEAADGLRSAREMQARIRDARTEAELQEIMQEVDGEVEDDVPPTPQAGAAVAVAVVGTLAAEVALRRWTAHRVSADVRFPRLPAALARGALTLMMAPALRSLEQKG